jgi:hypothetical protein
LPTDRGPGPDGLETEQIFTIDLRTGERHQVTRLARTTPPPSPERTVNGVRFASSDTISFLHYRPEGAERLAVRIDGTGLRPRPVPAELGNGVRGRVVPTFGISNARLDIVQLAIPGVPENAAYLPTYAIREVFRVVGRNLIQLTNFRRVETQWVGARPRDVLFLASGDPLGTNRLRNCQLFRVSPYRWGTPAAHAIRAGVSVGGRVPAQRAVGMRDRPRRPRGVRARLRLLLRLRPVRDQPERLPGVRDRVGRIAAPPAHAHDGPEDRGGRIAGGRDTWPAGSRWRIAGGRCLRPSGPGRALRFELPAARADGDESPAVGRALLAVYAFALITAVPSAAAAESLSDVFRSRYGRRRASKRDERWLVGANDENPHCPPYLLDITECAYVFRSELILGLRKPERDRLRSHPCGSGGSDRSDH